MRLFFHELAKLELNEVPSISTVKAPDWDERSSPKSSVAPKRSSDTPKRAS
jgi:hypothetical protein